MTIPYYHQPNFTSSYNLPVCSFIPTQNCTFAMHNVLKLTYLRKLFKYVGQQMVSQCLQKARSLDISLLQQLVTNTAKHHQVTTTDGAAILHYVHKKQSQRIFSIILFRTDEILQNLENLFLNLIRTQPQLHFQWSLCNILTRDIVF